MASITRTSKLLIITGPEFWLRGHGPNHPLKPERLQRTHELLAQFGAFKQEEVRTLSPRPATWSELKLFHSDEYLDAVESLSEGRLEVEPGRFNFGPGDNPVFPGMFQSEGLKVGSALQAAQAIQTGQASIAFSYAGGLHHATPRRASGFCVFNDAAVAITWLKSFYGRIFYLDIDVHHGDGVQNAFYHDPTVFTCSIHQDPRTLFPGTGYLEETGKGSGDGYCANIPLPPGSDGEIYQRAFDDLILPLIKRFDPAILVTQLGVDTHFEDPLARMQLTTEDQEKIYLALADLDLPWLALGGGGYALHVVPRSWTLAVGAMIGIDFPSMLPARYRKRYGGNWLHDSDRMPNKPAADESTRQQAARILKDCQVKLLAK